MSDKRLNALKFHLLLFVDSNENLPLQKG